MKQVARLAILSLLIVVSHLVAAPHSFLPIEAAQPDGSRINIYASGDEFHNWLHDENNYTIVRDADGAYVYAIQERGSLAPSDLLVGRDSPSMRSLIPGLNLSQDEIKAKYDRYAQMRDYSNGRAPHTGQLNNIVIFIKFSNSPNFSTPFSYYQQIFNASATADNSMKRYFQAASYNQLNVDSHFYPAPNGNVVVCYTDIYPRGYYQPYSNTNPNGYSGDNERTQREHQLLVRAVNAVSSQIPATLNIDGDNDGYVDNVCFIIQGQPDGWSDLLWPHRWALYTATAYINNKQVWDFNFQLESSLNNSGASVLSHEMFHSLGAPDLYRYYNDTIDPIGSWDLMSTNLNPPQHMSVWMKHKYGQWINNVPTITASGTYTLSPVASSSTNNIYRINSWRNDEYYVLEYRKPQGIYDANLPGTGLLVYRLDTREEGNANGPPDELYIYRPGGSNTVNGNLEQAFFSQQSGRTEISEATAPNGFLGNGTAGGLNLFDIGQAGNTISFKVKISDIQLTSPHGGEVWQSGTNKVITWKSKNSTGTVKLEYSSNGGQSWTQIATGVGNTGSYTWNNVPSMNDSQNVHIRVSLIGTTHTDSNYYPFTVTGGSSLPPPSDLTATVQGRNVNLSWLAPGGPPPEPDLVDSFETYTDFTLNFNPWVCVDVDGSGTYSIQGYTWPNAHSPQAFMVFNPTTTTPPHQTLTAKDGVKMAACFASTSPPNNDWLISHSFTPQAGQFLNFWARSYTAQWGLERFKVGISQGGTAPADFNIITSGSYVQAPAEWTLYSFNMSAYVGQSIRFGINCLSNDAFIFLVDDVTVGPVPSNTPRNLYAGEFMGPAIKTSGVPVPGPVDSNPNTRNLLGYKVYRNGTLIATVTGTDYVDANVAYGTHTYTVTANYTAGESAPTNPVTVTIAPTNLPPPTNLQATLAGTTANLTWDAPTQPETGSWISWSGNELYTSIGTGGAAVFDVAHRFTQADLTNVSGGTITQVKFVPHEANCVYTVKVWTGGSATNSGSLVSSQVVPNPTFDQWNTVILNTPVTIPTTGDVYIGYECNTQTGFPAGCDSGPAIAGKGDMIKLSGGSWQSLSAGHNLDYNWLIQTYVNTSRGGALLQPQPIAEATPPSYPDAQLAKADLETPITLTNPEDISRQLLGYKVYRNGNLIATINQTHYNDPNLTAGTHSYTVTANYTEGESEPAGPVSVTINPTPLPPTNLQATVAGTTANLTWNAPNNQSNASNKPTGTRQLLGYKVYRNGNLIATVNQTNFSDTNLNAGTYSYTVTANYTYGESAPAGPVTVTINPTPLPPTNLQATVAGTTANLTWNAPNNQSNALHKAAGTRQLLGYKVYRNGNLIATVNQTHFSDTNLNAGTYSYTVTANYTYGESVPAGPVTVTINPTPLPPTNLQATVAGTTANLTWNAPNNQSNGANKAAGTRQLLGYKVYRNGNLIATVNQTHFSDTNLNAGTYSYTVTANYTYGESAPAGPVVVVITELPAPTDLSAEVVDNNVTLSWTNPSGPNTGQWITWCADEIYSGIGTNGAVQFQVAHRFPQSDLTVLNVPAGATVTQVEFAPMYQDCVYTVKVWTGGSATNPGTLVSSQVVNNFVIQEWNLVDLDTPVPIPATGDLWVGYEVNTQGGYPAGCDEGPQIEGKGNIMYFNGQWTTLTQVTPSLTYNWSIKTFVSDPRSGMKAIELTPIAEAPLPAFKGTEQLSARLVDTDNSTRAVTGYKVYRDGNLIATITDSEEVTYTDLGLPNGTYLYGVSAVHTTGESAPATIEVTVQLTFGQVVFTDDFESYPDFATEFAPWSLLDSDNSATYGIQGVTFPGSGAPMAYIIFNPTATVPPIDGLTAHSGSKMAACFAATNPPNNDYLITPRVSLGTNSKFRFFARSYTAQWGLERFRVGVSTAPMITPNFQWLDATYREAPANWTEYIYDLNSYNGSAIRVAINCQSDDAFIFCIDDATIHSDGGTANDDNTAPALTTRLEGNYPNPFNPSTTIRYSLQEASPVSIEIYNLRGQLVHTLVDEFKETGNHSVIWNGLDQNNRSVPSGVFLYRMKAGKYSSTKKMIMLK